MLCFSFFSLLFQELQQELYQVMYLSSTILVPVYSWCLDLDLKAHFTCLSDDSSNLKTALFYLVLSLFLFLFC